MSMFGNLGEMAGLMKKVGEIQKNMKNMKAELADTALTGKDPAGKVVVEMTDGAILAMTTAVEYKLLPPEKVTAPRIVEVCLLDANAQESTDLAASPGGAVRIHGNNIKADLSDSTQGVFLVAQDKSQTRMAKYTRNGTNVIDFMLPADLGTGTYTVLFVNKSDNGTVQESKYAEAITVA